MYYRVLHTHGMTEKTLTRQCKKDVTVVNYLFEVVNQTFKGTVFDKKLQASLTSHWTPKINGVPLC